MARIPKGRHAIVYVIGGFVPGSGHLDSCEMLDIQDFYMKAQDWKAIDSLTDKKAGCSAVVTDKKIWVFEGFDCNKKFLTTIESYETDPQFSNVWTVFPVKLEVSITIVSFIVLISVY